MVLERVIRSRVLGIVQVRGSVRVVVSCRISMSSHTFWAPGLGLPG